MVDDAALTPFFEPRNERSTGLRVRFWAVTCSARRGGTVTRATPKAGGIKANQLLWQWTEIA